MGRAVASRRGPVRRCRPILSPRHRHLAVASFTALALFGLADDDALGVARVGLGGGNLVVAVDNDGDQNATHGLVVQPFTDIARDGFRVRQDALGVATITTSDPDCTANPVFNDVVCSGARGSLDVTMRGGADRVTLRDANASSDACFVGAAPSPVINADVTLGGGDDLFLVQDCSPGSAGPGGAAWRVSVDGGAGADTLRGGPFDDTLLAGFDDAVGVVNDLEGRGGNDLLRGSNRRDILDGDAGDDTLRGGDGRDSFSGGEGDDLLHGGLNGGGPDTFVGGPGIDTVTYAFAGTGVTVTIFDPLNATASQAPDGQPGEGDFVQGDIENLIGSGNNDTLTGNNLANRIDGSNGDDTIAGGAGPDVLLGGEGNDAINSRDGEADPFIDCGPGTRDSANLDLVDRPRASRTNPLTSPVNCEITFFFATDDGPPGRLTQSVLRPNAHGIARVRLACPKNARVTCRGTLRLRQPRPPKRVLRSKRYAVRRGTTGKILLNVPASLRGRRALLETTEKGVSRKGPRGTARTVAIR
jgi:Ca2+-binding RTX toxin-like protein